MPARLRGPTARINASTAIWALARYTAAPPTNEKNTIMITEVARPLQRVVHDVAHEHAAG